MSATTEIPTNDKDDKLLYLITFRKSLNDIYVKYVFLNNNFIFADDNQSMQFTEGYKLATDEKITDDFKEVVTITEQTADSYILLFTKDGKISHKSDLVTITNELITGNFEKVNLEDFISHDAITDITSAFKNISQIGNNINAINNVITEYNTSIKTIDTISYDAVSNNKEAEPTLKRIINDYSKAYNELLNITYFRKFMSLNMEKLDTEISEDQQSVVAELKQGFYEQKKDDLNTISKTGIDFNISKYNHSTSTALEKAVYEKLKNLKEGSETEDIISTKDFIRYLSNIKNNFYHGKSTPESINFLIELISKHVAQMKDILEKESNILKILHSSDKSKDYQHAINTLIRNNMKNNILTFIKIRNDQKNTYNRRFDIQLNSGGKPKNLILKYNDDNLQYYEKDNIPNQQFNTNDDYKQVGSITQNNDIEIKKYNRKYILGEFTEIFEPKVENREIAEKMDIVKKQLLSDKPKPVFIMGYGASGAGKTSTLIYFKKEEKDGILIELCNQLRGTYDQISIDHKEFYNSDCARKDGEGATKNDCKDDGNDSGKGKSFIEKPVKNCSASLDFTYIDDNMVKNNPDAYNNKKSGGFLLDKEYTHNIHHQFRVKKTEKENEPQTAKTFNQYESLGNVIIYLIDTDRHVKATTNNPNSSRSHSLIFVNFKSSSDEKKNAYLIVGDFAGVENEFNCDNPSVLTDFQNIIGDDGTRFYENEQDKDGKLDPIGSNTTCENKNTNIQIGGGGNDEKVGELFDFENPDYEKIKNAIGQESRYKTPHFDKNIEFVRGIAGIFKTSNDYKLAPQELINSYDNNYNDYKNQYETLKALFNYTTSKNSAYIKEFVNAINKTKSGEQFEKFVNNTIKQLFHNGGAPNLPKIRETKATPELKYHYKTISKSLSFDTFENIYPELNEYKNIITSAFENINDNIFTSNDAKSEIKTLLDELRIKLGLEINSDNVFNTIFNNTTKLQTLINKIYQVKFVERSAILNNIKNEVNTISTHFIDKPEGELIFGDGKFYNFIKTEDEKRTKQLGLMQEVCTHRRTEGYFINDSLKNVRDIIRLALYEKNKDALNLLPNYVDICFDKYCPTHTNCFALNSNTNKIDSNKSIIFNNIYEYLKSKPGALDIESKKEGMLITEKEEYEKNTKLQMYKDLMICVFCVFNISYGANNPPPVPYVDINELKRIVYNNDIFADNKKTDFIAKSNELIKTINSKFIQKYTDNTGKTQSKNLLEDLKKKSPEPKDHGLQTENKIDNSYDLFKYLILHFEKSQNNEGQHGGGERNDHVKFEKKLIQFLELNIARINVVLELINNNLKIIGRMDNKNTEKWTNFVSLLQTFFPDSNLSVNKDRKKLYDEMKGLMKIQLDKYTDEAYPDHGTFNVVMRNTGSINKEITVFKTPEKNEKNEKELKERKKNLNTIIKTLNDRRKIKISEDSIANAQNEVITQQQELQEQPVPVPVPDVEITLTDDNNLFNWRLINGSETRNKYIKYIHDFIEQVDTNNAISAVGTIEFMDKLSKLDMVATICNDEDETLIPKFKENDIELRPLYEKPSGGDSKRYTKRKGVSNNKTRKNRV